ncbi:MAG: sigma-70 family RNA polymerase sigma factor, partial [Pirellula sp.]
DTLLVAARNGDANAMGIVFEHFRPFLLQIANEELDPRLRQKAGGSDLVQKTFLEAGMSIQKFEGDTPESISAWLRQILLNNILSHRRTYLTQKRNIQREVLLTGDGSSAMRLEEMIASQSNDSDSIHSHESREIVAHAFSSLAEAHQQIIRYRSEQQLPFLEIAELMDRTPEAARKLWARAVEAFKLEIDKRKRP